MPLLLLNRYERVARTFVVSVYFGNSGQVDQVSGSYKLRKADGPLGFSCGPAVKQVTQNDKRSLSLRINPKNHARKFPGVRSTDPSQDRASKCRSVRGGG